jgi:predicted phosphodiesterase
MIRVFAISDLHVDYDQNLNWVKNLSNQDYQNDTLLVAGDISDNVEKFSDALGSLYKKFKIVSFVPGNHDLWVRGKETGDSLEKFYLLNNICATLSIKTAPFYINDDTIKIKIQPLFSWYLKPEEGSKSLFLEKPGEDPSLGMWVDNYTIKWPNWDGFKNAADFFLKMNEWKIEEPDTVTISFSHFLPRQDLIFGKKKPADLIKAGFKDPAPKFNFSRVAGTAGLEKQIRTIGSSAHIYGHQHRNRFREIDGILYISHGLGYPKERAWAGLKDEEYLPKLIWDSENGFVSGMEY